MSRESCVRPSCAMILRIFILKFYIPNLGSARHLPGDCVSAPGLESRGHLLHCPRWLETPREETVPGEVQSVRRRAYSQWAKRWENHSLTLRDKGLLFHSSHRTSSDSARSPVNIFSISTANSRLRITAFTSSLLEKLQKSILVEPTVDQTPSITRVFAWSRALRRLYSFTPDFK